MREKIEFTIETVLTKGVFEVFPNKDFLSSLLRSGKQLTIYAGFDPTAPTLHLGHTIQLRKLRQFQDLGHKIIFLVGDFTAMIGDPTDKLAARTQLSEKEVKKNLKKYKSQAGRIIRFSGKNKALVKFNSNWLGKLKFKNVISIASLMTVDQMLKRDMFERRIMEGKPIYLHEFLYPLLQGYDSVALKVDGEVGGSDQTFNMLAGRTLEGKLLQKEKFVLTMKLLEDGNGKKMGKSEGNMVTLDDTPEDVYGKIMSWPDTVIPVGLELLTDMTLAEIGEFLTTTINPKEQKMKLALETVRAVWGEKAAAGAQLYFTKLFQNKEVPENIRTYTIDSKNLADFIISKKLVSSRSELRRLAAEGAIEYMTEKKILQWDDLVQNEPAKIGVYRIGKSRYFKIV